MGTVCVEAGGKTVCVPTEDPRPAPAPAPSPRLPSPTSFEGFRSAFQAIKRSLSGYRSNSATGRGNPLSDPNYFGPPVRFRPQRPAPTVTKPPAPAASAIPSGVTSLGQYGRPTRKSRAARRKKCKKGWYQCWLDSMSADSRTFIEPAIFGVIEQRAYNAGNIGGMSRSRAPRSSTGARMLTRQNPFNFTAPQRVKQGGFLDTTGLLKPPVVATRLPTYGPSAQRPSSPGVRAISSIDEVNLPGALDEVQVSAQRVGRATLPGVESAPGTAPETRTEDYVNDAVISSAVERAGIYPAYPLDPGLGPTATTRGAAGVARTATKPATAAPGTRTAAKVARTGLGKIGLSLESLLVDAVGQSARRSPGVGTIRLPARSTVTSPGRQAQPGYANPIGFAGYPGAVATKTKTDECSCDERKKKREPRAPRTECWKGTYTESARGLSKTRRERVPC